MRKSNDAAGKYHANTDKTSVVPTILADSYIAQSIMSCVLVITLWENVEEDGHIEQNCSGNNKVIEIATWQLHQGVVKPDEVMHS